MHVRILLLLPLLILPLACKKGGSGGGGGAVVVPVAAAFDVAFGGEVFSRALKLVQHPTDDDRWYVVEQRGRIFTLLASNPAATRQLVLDIEDLLDLATGNEQGLLSMAFDPGFAVNREVFLSYTEDTGSGVESVVARFESLVGDLTFVSTGADETVLRFAQQQSNHNGGDLAFGPDGFLYYAMGDGGGAGDPDPEDGQDVTTLFGTIMRIDVSVVPYQVPPDNPFVGSAGRDEIWAYGLRNPWRMSFDRATGELWLGDVGQLSREEIDLIVKGGNYGWDCREGDLSFDPDPNCSPPFVEPLVVHPRAEAASITGGYVYRGANVPVLIGAYVYGDFIRGNVFAYFPGTQVLEQLTPPAGLNISSFGQGRDGEVYVVTFGSPSIYVLAPVP